MNRRALITSAFAGVVGVTVARAGPLSLLGAGKPLTSTPPPVDPPINSVAPEVVGLAQVGQTLVTTTGTWSNSPTGYSYQWTRNGANIGGATGVNYTQVLADEGKLIRSVVIASNSAGPSSPATSAPVGPVLPAGTIPTAPPSITNPSVGLPLTDQWALQADGATGPRHGFSNGAWNTTYPEAATGSGTPGQPPNDPYLVGLGFIYNNYGDLWIPFAWNDPGGDATVADYDFEGSPDLTFWGDGSDVIITDCANFDAKMGLDANRNPSTMLMGLQITYCDENTTRWDLLCSCTFELGPYNRIRNQPQELGFGGGYLQAIYIGIKIHHNFITGGGCNPAVGAHVEWLQSILATAATGSYVYVEDNMIDFSVDGQDNPAIREGWTGVISCGGDQRIKWNRNVLKGMDIVQWLGLHPPGGMGTVVAYGDANVLAGCEIMDNAFSYNPSFGPSFKHGGGSLKPTQSGNRWFRDADSNLAGVPLVKADNVPLTNADFG